MDRTDSTEEERFHLEIGIVCFIFLALVSLVIQLTGGFTMVWTVIGSVGVVVSILLFVMMKGIRNANSL